MTEHAYKSGNVATDRDALILEHLPLLHHIVGRMSLDAPGLIERDDLMGWGVIGLIAAADSFDATRGLKFSTYAFPRIRGAILDEIRRMDFLPRGRREKVRELDRVVGELEQASGVPPTPEEIAAALGVGPDEVDEIMHSARIAGCASLNDGPSEELVSMLSDPRSDDPVGSSEWMEMKELLVKCIASLPSAEQTVITLYYGEELLLKEIGQVMNVTESRVSQVHSRALYCLNRKIKAAMDGP